MTSQPTSPPNWPGSRSAVLWIAAIVLPAAIAIALLACASAVQGVRPPPKPEHRTPARPAAPAKPAAAPAIAKNCTLYGAPGGSDSAPGSSSQPFRTVQRLASALAPGGVGCLHAGTYAATMPSGLVLRMTRAGRAGAPITIRSLPGERARLEGIVALQPEASNVTLAHLTIVGLGRGNTIKFYGNDQALVRSYVTNDGHGLSCLLLGNPQYPRVLRPVVRANTFRDCGDRANANKDHAIYAAVVDGGEIVDNVISSPAAYAIQFYPDAQRTRFAHNVIDGGDSVRGGVAFGGDGRDASSDNVVEYNVIAYASTWNVGSSFDGPLGRGNVVRRNCLWAGGQRNIADGAGFVATHNRIASPDFVNRADGDFRLGPGSRCLAIVQYDTARERH